jgi:hypothetical protein
MFLKITCLPAQQKSQQRRLDQTLKIDQQIEAPALAAYETDQKIYFSKYPFPGFQIKNHDLINAGKIFQQGGTGRFNDPGYSGFRKMRAQQLESGEGMNDVPQRRQTNNGDAFQFSRIFPLFF